MQFYFTKNPMAEKKVYPDFIFRVVLPPFLYKQLLLLPVGGVNLLMYV